MLRISTDSLVNVATLATCCFVVAVTVRESSRRTRYTDPVENQRIVAGTKADKLPGVKYEAAATTAVLFFRTTCQYCIQGTAFYKKLAATIKADPSAQFVVVTLEEPRITEAYFKQEGISVTMFVDGQGQGKPTPVLLAVDSAGVVRDVWMGKQTEEVEETIIRKVVATSQAVTGPQP